MRSGKYGMLDGAARGWMKSIRGQFAACQKAAWDLQGIIEAYCNTHPVLPVETQTISDGAGLPDNIRQNDYWRLVKQVQLIGVRAVCRSSERQTVTLRNVGRQGG